MSEKYNDIRKSRIGKTYNDYSCHMTLTPALSKLLKYLDDKIDKNNSENIELDYWNKEALSRQLIKRINNINNFIRNNYKDEYDKDSYNDEYDDDENKYINYEFVMIYDKNDDKIKLNNQCEDSTNIFNDKLGSIFKNKINIFLSMSGYIIYEYDRKYSRYLIESENVKISDFDDYREKNLNRLNAYCDGDYIPKIYKSYLINSIKIDPVLTLAESIEYLSKFEYNHNILSDELDFMENEFYKKLNNQNTLILDLQTKLNEQLKLNETLCKRLFELKN
jgi:hypothetical protein